MKFELTTLIDQVGIAFPALIGGMVDYLNQMQKGVKKWNPLGFCVHLLSAIFFGWVTGTIVGELGYSLAAVSVGGGVGGFLGVRVADLITYKMSGGKL